MMAQPLGHRSRNGFLAFCLRSMESAGFARPVGVQHEDELEPGDPQWKGCMACFCDPEDGKT